MKDIYPFEKFSLALEALAINPQRLQKRIASAFAFNLSLLLDHPGLPDDATRKLRGYSDEWKSIEDPAAEGKISVWANRLSDDDAMEIARWIVDTCNVVKRGYWGVD